MLLSIHRPTLERSLKVEVIASHKFAIVPRRCIQLPWLNFLKGPHKNLDFGQEQNLFIYYPSSFFSPAFIVDGGVVTKLPITNVVKIRGKLLSWIILGFFIPTFCPFSSSLLFSNKEKYFTLSRALRFMNEWQKEAKKKWNPQNFFSVDHRIAISVFI